MCDPLMIMGSVSVQIARFRRVVVLSDATNAAERVNQATAWYGGPLRAACNHAANNT
jgi:hypothetical protein